MIYAIILAFIAGLSLGTVGMKEWKDGQIAKQAQAVAQKKIDDAATAARREAENKIVDMEAAYIAGESNAKTVVQRVYVKGQNYVSSQPVFQNPVCVVPADGMLAVNSARAGMRAAADPGESAASVPAAGADQGRPVGNPVPASDSGHGSVGGVHPPPQQPSGSGQVSGPNVRPVPKPKPAAG
jgi:hypothetical protein